MYYDIVFLGEFAIHPLLLIPVWIEIAISNHPPL
jgi:hypothetical protein